MWHRADVLRRTFCESLGVPEKDRHRMIEEDVPAWRTKWLAEKDPTALLSEYGTDWYASYTLECFLGYTRANVRAFAKWWKETGQSGEVLDLGGGIGASTRLFEELTDAECILHAYAPGPQVEVAKGLVGPSTVAIGMDETQILLALRPRAVMAFELFEHIRDPCRVLGALTKTEVDVLCCANAFGAEDFGHWPSYLVHDREVPRDRMGVEFGRELRRLGWEKQDTGFWNNRPSIYVRQEAQQLSLGVDATDGRI